MEAFDSVRLAYGYAQYDYAHWKNFPSAPGLADGDLLVETGPRAHRPVCATSVVDAASLAENLDFG
jgi:hypothetical protein